jgi:hypothetical protein
MPNVEDRPSDDDPRSAYLTEAERLIRRRENDGEITVFDAARERIITLERHLAESKALRELHFGGGTGRP